MLWRRSLARLLAEQQQLIIVLQLPQQAVASKTEMFLFVANLAIWAVTQASRFQAPKVLWGSVAHS